MIESPSDPLVASWFAHATQAPSSPALVARGQRPMTFGELAERTRLLGSRLASWNIRRGDIVVWPVLARETSAAALAIVPASATLAPLSAALSVDEYATVLARLNAKAIAVPAGATHPSITAARRLGITEIAISAESGGAVGAFDMTLACASASLDAAPSVAADIAYVSMTSGTTGRAKLVPHALTPILTTTKGMAERLAIGPADISAHVGPLHLANGLRSAYLLALLQGGAVNLLPEGDVDALIEAIAAGEVTYAGAAFTLLREVLTRLDGRGVAAGRLRFLRVTSGRLEPEEIERLAAAFGVPVLAGLASTETGTLTHQRLPPAPVRRDSLGPPIACEIRLVDEAGKAVAPGEVGEVEVRGPQVLSGYIDDQELTAQAFRDGWFRMGDLARFDADGELYLAGRRKEMINRGGEKISPVEVDAVLRSLGGVADAGSFGIAHPRLGEELVAAVVPAPGVTLDASALLQQARALLGAKRTPRRLWFVDRLPRTESAKLKRSELPALVGLLPASATLADDAAADTSALAALWAAVLDVERVAADDDFFLLGGDSLRAAALLGRVQGQFGVTIPIVAVFAEASTVNGMLQWIERERGQSSGTSTERGPGLQRLASG
jgi:acyl-CoA synthetase (AMP-forming)/AMP-acid ligase II/acyl carrier protein